MNYIEKSYNELIDLKGSILLLKDDIKHIDKKFNEILLEIRDTDFNVEEAVQMYKEMQRFLQERRLTKTQLEELEIQYEVLGGDEQLTRYQKGMNIKTIRNDIGFKKDSKYYRQKKYFNNFDKDLKEKVDNMFHLV